MSARIVAPVSSMLHCANLLDHILCHEPDSMTLVSGQHQVSFNAPILCSLSPLLADLANQTLQDKCCSSHDHIYVHLPDIKNWKILNLLKTFLSCGEVDYVSRSDVENLEELIETLGINIATQVQISQFVRKEIEHEDEDRQFVLAIKCEVEGNMEGAENYCSSTVIKVEKDQYDEIKKLLATAKSIGNKNSTKIDDIEEVNGNETTGNDPNENILTESAQADMDVIGDSETISGAINQCTFQTSQDPEGALQTYQDPEGAFQTSQNQEGALQTSQDPEDVLQKFQDQEGALHTDRGSSQYTLRQEDLEDTSLINGVDLQYTFRKEVSKQKRCLPNRKVTENFKGQLADNNTKKIKRVPKSQNNEVHIGELYSCSQCNFKTKNKRSLEKHQRVHGIKYACNECDYSGIKENLKRHEKSVHKKSQYPCNQCDYIAAQNQNLRNHIESVHNEIQYPCSQCDYKAKRKSNVKRHFDSVHAKIEYFCSQCNYKAKQRCTLKNHVASVHDGVEYPCDECEFRAKRKDTLARHNRKVHK